MKKNLHLIIAFILALNCLNLFAQEDSINDKESLIYSFNIDSDIAPPMLRRSQKAFKEAKELKADLIFINLDTYGGQVNVADSLRTMILNSPIPVWILINNNAASAGALISIACDSIFMKNGSTIGAASVVDQQGNIMPDKYQSYMRAKMRATAEQTDRDPNIAEAMVDPDIYIAEVSDSGKVLTFTVSEAIENDYCQGNFQSMEEALEYSSIKDYKIVKQEITAMDKFVSFLINPFISSLFIMMIIGGIYYELQSPGIGFALGVAIFGAVLYFAPLYVEGLAEHWEIVLFILGVVLIGVEIFAFPGFGVTGIMGVILIILSLGFALIGNVGFDFRGVDINTIISSFGLVTTMIFITILLSFWVTKKLFNQNGFARLSLEKSLSVEEGYTTIDNTYTEMLNREGTAMTDLRPAGKVIIEGEIFDAVAQLGYVNKDEKIEVIAYQNAQLIVNRKSK